MSFKRVLVYIPAYIERVGNIIQIGFYSYEYIINSTVLYCTVCTSTSKIQLASKRHTSTIILCASRRRARATRYSVSETRARHRSTSCSAAPLSATASAPTASVVRMRIQLATTAAMRSGSTGGRLLADDARRRAAAIVCSRFCIGLMEDSPYVYSYYEYTRILH